MIENFLHYIWLHKKFNVLNLKTTQNESLQVISIGTNNHNQGPDFFNGRVRIDGQQWAGNIEIHVKSSDWFVHNHETDPSYDNVILHVVFDHDTEIFRKDGTTIPTLELKNYIDENVLDRYKKLISKPQKWINCENDFLSIPDFLLNNWLERIYIERVERKSEEITVLLNASAYDWEAVLFKMLTKTFGLKVNGEAFISLANSFDFAIVRKSQKTLNLLEALFFGQAGLLEKDHSSSYYINLKNDYKFLSQKFQLENQGVLPFKFFRLRPSNFPTIRISQLAQLYYTHTQLFSKLMAAQSLSQYYDIFDLSASSFWESHYTFSKASKSKPKKLTKTFVNLLLINAILPLKFCYARHQKKDVDDSILSIMEAINSEDNIIVKGFNQLGFKSKSALQSQALIQLKTEYCDKHQCLKCAIGNSLLNK